MMTITDQSLPAFANFDIPEVRFHCTFVRDGEENKFSAGFYDHHFISDRTAVKFDAYFAIMYVICGWGKYTDYLRRDYPLRPGVLVFRHPGTYFTSLKKRDEHNRWLEFSSALPADFYRTLVQSGIITPDLTWVEPGLEPELLRLAGTYVNTMAGISTATGRALAYGKFLEFLSTAMVRGLGRQPLERHADEIAIERARALLGDQFERRLSMHQVARQVGMGYEKFRKLFTDRCGVSPNEYRILRRLEQADALLRHSALSIKEIALQLGYSAESSFTRQYRVFRGETPSQIRHRMK